MRKSLKKIISMLIIIVMFGLVITGCVEKKTNTLTQAQKIEDFKYMYKIIEVNYPFLEVNKRVNGVDWLAKKDEYMEEIKKCKNDEEFSQTLDNILSELNNGHTHVLNQEEYRLFFLTYSKNKRFTPWYEELSMPQALKRYSYDPDKEKEKNFMVEDNVKTKIINDNIGYMRIKSFIVCNLESDKDKINNFINEIKNLDALIIDIRGNGGGTPKFWAQNILSPLIENTLSTNFCYFIRGGEFAQKFYFVNNLPKVRGKGNGEIKVMKELSSEIFTDFKYYCKKTISVKPKDSINFKGKVFLLVDQGVYSAAEMLAVYAKETSFATIIGETTGGDGITMDPVLCTLPYSGLVFRFSLIMGTNESGICNEEFKTTPDYIVDAEITDNIEDDKCIQKAIELAKEEKNH